MSVEGLYREKDEPYFSTARRDIIDRLSPDPHRRILEIGCGNGATGAYAKSTGKCGYYAGVELFAPMAEVARRTLDEVHAANVETFAWPFDSKSFDVIAASEVLEHLVDPWAVLQKLRPLLKPDGRIYASSPNVAHKSTLIMLLDGRWDYETCGRMDRTHVRWFTPATYAEMFRASGYEVVSVRPHAPVTGKAKLFNALTRNRFAHLFVSQIDVEARAA